MDAFLAITVSLRRVALVGLSLWLVLVLPAGTGVAVAGQEATADVADAPITLYTSVTQDTVDAVLAAYEAERPGARVALFRAPTGELDARLAAEARSGGVGADVLWLSDPISMQHHEASGLLAALSGPAFEAVPAVYRGETFVGTRLLNLVIVVGADETWVPSTWSDLADEALAGRVAIPDPGFAGSAFAALGYFGTLEGEGIELYRRLKDNGAVQVPSPGDVLTGVAEGRFAAGMSLDKMVRDAADKGAPIELVWPADGAIAVASPAAVVATTSEPDAAQAFVEFLVSPAAQTAIAATGWQPVREDIAWPHPGDTVVPDWQRIAGIDRTLLERYRTIFSD